jgi:Pyruvate/2-oxoglutarate dehydrogenase complex, dihydrolipoamide dehydrogenase (E3) component, and related enzymes
MAKEYDVIVIGSGPAGYVAAIRCAPLGFKTACVEKWVDEKNESVLGGTCLNVGCLPSKALLDSSQKFIEAQEGFDVPGIKVSKISIDVPSMMSRKNKVVGQLTPGIKGLFAANQVDSLSGTGKLSAINEVPVTDSDGNSQKPPKRDFVIATGSLPLTNVRRPLTIYQL